MPLPMIASILEHEDADTFLHPALPAIHRYDQEHKTDYFQTLYEYLMNMLDKQRRRHAGAAQEHLPIPHQPHLGSCSTWTWRTPRR